jgi:hypothetical protein
MILVFDDQNNLWTDVFSSIYVYSSQYVKWFWTKALRELHLKENIGRLLEDLSTSSKVQYIRQEKPEKSNSRFKKFRLPVDDSGAPADDPTHLWMVQHAERTIRCTRTALLQ